MENKPEEKYQKELMNYVGKLRAINLARVQAREVGDEDGLSKLTFQGYTLHQKFYLVVLNELEECRRKISASPTGSTLNILMNHEERLNRTAGTICTILKESKDY